MLPRQAQQRMARHTNSLHPLMKINNRRQLYKLGGALCSELHADTQCADDVLRTMVTVSSLRAKCSNAYMSRMTPALLDSRHASIGENHCLHKVQQTMLTVEYVCGAVIRATHVTRPTCNSATIVTVPPQASMRPAA